MTYFRHVIVSCDELKLTASSIRREAVGVVREVNRKVFNLVFSLPSVPYAALSLDVERLDLLKDSVQFVVILDLLGNIDHIAVVLSPDGKAPIPIFVDP